MSSGSSKEQQQNQQQKEIEKALEKMRLANKKEGGESVDKQEIVKALSQLHGDGGLIGALQAKLDGLVGLSSGYVEELHPKNSCEIILFASLTNRTRRVVREVFRGAKAIGREIREVIRAVI